MKLKLQQIVDAQMPLLRLASEKYPANIAYRIQRNITHLDRERNAINDVMLKTLQESYGGKQNAQDSRLYEPAEEHRAAWLEEKKKLLDEQVEVDVRMIALSDLREIMPIDLMVIEWMIEDPDQPRAPTETAERKLRKRSK